MPPMSSNSTLGKIPVTVVGTKPGNGLHWKRRAFQWATILVAILIPVSGLFRVDPIAGAFVILDRQIWWSDFFLVFGFWVIFASSLVMLYSTVGTAFCGWSCPQNSIAEWANHMTTRFLGKRAQVSLEGEKMKVASSKNRWLNWFALGLALLLPAMLFALIPLFYFYPPDVIWSFITFRDDERLAASLHYIYLIFVLVFFVDAAFLRHFWCRFMCVYKIWQHGFKTRQTLHISYDKDRSAECEKCNYCVTSCFIDLDPRQTEIYDTCINCGECITACDTLQARKNQAGLLRFKLGQSEKTQQNTKRRRISLGGLSERMRWTIPFTLMGVFMVVWGLLMYEQYHLAVYRADLAKAERIQDYRVAVSNKLYEHGQLSITVEGLPEGSYVLSSHEVNFDGVGRIDLNLHIKPVLPPGLHSVLVRAVSSDGWEDSFPLRHFVEKG